MRSPRMWHRLLGSIILVLISMPALAEKAPPVPEGYPNETAVKAAMALQLIEIVDVERPIPETIEEIKDIVYGRGGNRALHLDLYLPKQRETPSPAIIFIHGGAWQGGQRSDMRFYCIEFAQQGYVTATITYRLSGDAPFPAAVRDAKCAIRWLRAHAEEYDVDPSRIAVSGNSAGGHLSMMAGFAQDPELEGEGGRRQTSSEVCGVVNFYGPTDLTTSFAREQSAVIQFMGGKPYHDAKETYRQASPLMHLDERDPPTLTFHGTIDSTVPIAQADRLDKRMQELGLDHTYERYEGWPHTMDLAKPVNKRCVYIMKQFFARIFSNQNIN